LIEGQIAKNIIEKTNPEPAPVVYNENDDIDLLNFEGGNNENKENQTPKIKTSKEDELDLFNMDFSGDSPLLPLPSEDTKKVENVTDIDVDLTPITPPPPPPIKKLTLDDIDEFSLFDNLKK
jgi:hypothetical protein